MKYFWDALLCCPCSSFVGSGEYANYYEHFNGKHKLNWLVNRMYSNECLDKQTPKRVIEQVAWNYL